MNGAGVRRQASYSSDYDSRYSSGLGAQPSSRNLLDGYNGSLEITNEEDAHQSGYGNVSASAGAFRSKPLTDQIAERESYAEFGSIGSQRPSVHAFAHGNCHWR